MSFSFLLICLRAELYPAGKCSALNMQVAFDHLV